MRFEAGRRSQLAVCSDYKSDRLLTSALTTTLVRDEIVRTGWRAARRCRSNLSFFRPDNFSLLVARICHYVRFLDGERPAERLLLRSDDNFKVCARRLGRHLPAARDIDGARRLVLARLSVWLDSCRHAVSCGSRRAATSLK